MQQKSVCGLFLSRVSMNQDTSKNPSGPTKKRSRARRILLIAGGVLALCILLSVLALFAADRRVEKCAAGRVFGDVETVPAREYGLLPGTSRLVHGKYLNTYFYNRVHAAAALYRAGRIRKIIVSGDNSRTDYNAIFFPWS